MRDFDKNLESSSELQPVYLYRRLGNTDFSTCDRSRFVELSSHTQFETKIVYELAGAQAVEKKSFEVPEGFKLVPIEPTQEMLASCTTSTFEPLRREVMSMAEEDYRKMLAAAPQPPDEGASLADRMRAAGMLTVDEMISGAPLDAFIRHGAVRDLDSYGEWLDMKCREYLSMKASRDLEKREDDDLYEWVLAHAAVFQEARINFKTARLGMPDVSSHAHEPVAVVDKTIPSCEIQYLEGVDLPHGTELYVAPVENKNFVVRHFQECRDMFVKGSISWKLLNEKIESFLDKDESVVAQYYQECRDMFVKGSASWELLNDKIESLLEQDK